MKSKEARLYALMDSDNAEELRAFLRENADILETVTETPPPLHWAVWQGRSEVVKILLDAGADIEWLDPDREATPLDWAIVYGQHELISLLVSRGASQDGRVDLAKRGASGAFAQYGDEVATIAQFEASVHLLQQLSSKSQ